jgi:hypothetical protein
VYGTRFIRAPIRLVDRSGSEIRFGTLLGLCAYLQTHRPDLDIADSFDCGSTIVRDGSGRTIPPGLILYGQTARGTRAAARLGPAPGHRAGPWPGSGWTRRHRGATYRHVRTKACLTEAAAQAVDEWIDDQPQACRIRRIPTNRDDIARHRERCWKRQRATQYKPRRSGRQP